MGTPPPGGYSPHGTRHPLPANPLTRYLPPAQAPQISMSQTSHQLTTKFTMTAKKTHSFNEKVNTIYSFIQIGRESSLCKSEAGKTSLLLAHASFWVS